MERTAKPRTNQSLARFDSLPDSAFVRVDTVASLRDCSRATVWRHVHQGLLPAPVKLSPGITGWRVGDLRRALAAGQASEAA